MHLIPNSQNSIQGTIQDGFSTNSMNKILYNHSSYLELKRKSGFLFKEFIAKNKGEVIATIIFSIDGNTAFVGAGSPFGAIEFKSNIYFEQIEQILKTFRINLLAIGVKSVIWKHYADIYDSDNGSKVLQGLLNNGFEIDGHVLNFHLNLNESFEKHLAIDAKRRLKKCQTEAFTFSTEEHFDLDEFYSNLVKWRSSRSIPINMSKGDLKTHLLAIEGVYILVQLKKGSQSIASMILVKVSEAVLYTFLPSHDPDFDTYSPMIALTAHAHAYGKERGFKILDLGVASVSNERENYGLIRFKEKMGGISTIKVNLVLQGMSNKKG